MRGSSPLSLRVYQRKPKGESGFSPTFSSNRTPQPTVSVETIWRSWNPILSSSSKEPLFPGVPAEAEGRTWTPTPLSNKVVVPPHLHPPETVRRCLMQHETYIRSGILEHTKLSGFQFFKLMYLFSLEANYFTILWWFWPYINMIQPQVYMCPPSWTTPLTALPMPSLWVVPEHQLWVPCFMRWTCTGHLFYIW